MQDVRRLVPVVGDVVEVELDDRPEGLSHIGRVAVVQEPVGVGDDSGRPESRSIYTIVISAYILKHSTANILTTLGTTPSVGKCGLVDVEFGLAEAAGADRSARV